MEWVGPVISLIGQLAQIVAKALNDRDADTARLREDAAAAVQSLLGALAELPSAVAANDEAASSAARE